MMQSHGGGNDLAPATKISSANLGSASMHVFVAVIGKSEVWAPELFSRGGEA